MFKPPFLPCQGILSYAVDNYVRQDRFSISEHENNLVLSIPISENFGQLLKITVTVFGSEIRNANANDAYKLLKPGVARSSIDIPVGTV